MRRKTWIILSFSLGLILALGGDLATSSGWVLAQDGVVEGEGGFQAAVGTSFTYQGRLLHNGTPIDGTCDLEFSLWDAASGGTLRGMQTAYGVQVSDGYLSAELDFGGDAFKGDARYLQIRVNCGQGNVLLQPRQPLTAAPYALGLRPGASVESFSGTALSLSTYATTGAALNASITAPSGSAAAVYGSSSSPNGAGLSGYNAGSGTGVHGAAGGNTGTPYGVYGVASHGGSATSYGVYGKSNSSVGTGVGGEAPMNGLFGKATASNGQGVHGEATSSSGTTYGVYGKATSTGGTGVYGEGRTGVHGSSPDGAGVWGSSSNGWGVSGSSTNDAGVRGGSTNGPGVYGTAPVSGTVGIATALGGESTGVYGKATSLTGRGVYGEGGYYGVYAVGTDPTGVAHGVYGRTNSSATASSGVYGHASAGQGMTYGVYGRSDSPWGYGVYSDGDARVEGNLTVSGNLDVLGDIIGDLGDTHIDGDLTWKTKTSYVSLSPAAFQPPDQNQPFDQLGYNLSRNTFPCEDLINFVADVQLPHQATVTKFTVYWSFNANYPPPLSSFALVRADMETEELPEMATVTDRDAAHNIMLESSTTSITDPVVRNDRNIYFVGARMTGCIRLHGVIIEYEFSEPY